MWESCRTMSLVGGFSRGSPVSPALSFRRRFILTSITLIGSQDIDAKSPKYVHHPAQTLNNPRQAARATLLDTTAEHKFKSRMKEGMAKSVLWFRPGFEMVPKVYDLGALPMPGHFYPGKETIGRRWYGRWEGVPADSSGNTEFHLIKRLAGFPWRSRMVRRRSGVQEVLGSNPGELGGHTTVTSLPGSLKHSVLQSRGFRNGTTNHVRKSRRGTCRKLRRDKDKGDAATRIKCPIASNSKALNCRAVFLSHCVYLWDFQR
ncbi:hypothetical protein PR048_017777 [Dryococelus australis]|uniref:Uncharacterized protein n=1 Tax=Dryococelus australis TaxID=614101 RepID=A0ABQ9HAF8_9NEOP|nr:hypothetical protein PR048_017777 [Dryococelus australis]